MFCTCWIFTVTEKSLRQFQIWTQRKFLKFPRSVRLKTIFLGISSISRIKPIKRLFSQLLQMANRNSTTRQPHDRENAAKAPSGPVSSWPTRPGGKGHPDQRLAPPIFLLGGVSVQGCDVPHVGRVPWDWGPRLCLQKSGLQRDVLDGPWVSRQDEGQVGRQPAEAWVGREPRCSVRAQHCLSPAQWRSRAQNGPV